MDEIDITKGGIRILMTRRPNEVSWSTLPGGKGCRMMGGDLIT